MDALSTGALVAATVLPSFLLAWIGCFIVRRQAPRWGLVDKPDQRKTHARPIPLGGGLAMWAAVVATFAVASLARALAAPVDLPPSFDFAEPRLPGLAATLPQLWLLLGAATVVMGLGFADDCLGLRWRTRLVVQFLLAAAVVFGQGLLHGLQAAAGERDARGSAQLPGRNLRHGRNTRSPCFLERPGLLCLGSGRGSGSLFAFDG